MKSKKYKKLKKATEDTALDDFNCRYATHVERLTIVAEQFAQASNEIVAMLLATNRAVDSTDPAGREWIERTKNVARRLGNSTTDAYEVVRLFSEDVILISEIHKNKLEALLKGLKEMDD